VEVSAFIQHAISCLIYLVAGARLYRLSVRTGKAPERLLGASLLLWGASIPLYDIPYLLLGEPGVVPFSFAARVLAQMGTLIFAVFTRRVFRAQERWGTWLVIATAICLGVGVAGSVWVGDWEGIYPLSNPWYGLECVGSIAPMGWMIAEGFVQYTKARQRRRLGLCAPLVCNRFLLWGLVGILWLLLELSLIAQNVEYELTQHWSGSLDLLTASLDVVPVALVWLVFFPPARYRRWVEGTAAPLMAAEG
jgi:hypothetical protein